MNDKELPFDLIGASAEEVIQYIDFDYIVDVEYDSKYVGTMTTIEEARMTDQEWFEHNSTSVLLTYLELATGARNETHTLETGNTRESN